MAKSKETYNKREKEKQRIKQREEKREKMEQRKANGEKATSLEDMMAYVDVNGNISNTPPDPRMKKVFRAEDIQVGVPKYEPGEEADALRTGKVSYLNTSKGFGFIIDAVSGERVFVHIKEMLEPLEEGDKVQFLTEQGFKGLSALEVKKV